MKYLKKYGLGSFGLGWDSFCMESWGGYFDNGKERYTMEILMEITIHSVALLAGFACGWVAFNPWRI